MTDSGDKGLENKIVAEWLTNNGLKALHQSDIDTLIETIKNLAQQQLLRELLSQAIALTNQQKPGGTLIRAVPVEIIEQKLKELL